MDRTLCINAMSHSKGLFKVPKAGGERRRPTRTTDTNNILENCRNPKLSIYTLHKGIQKFR